jgi:hypothetical protein
MPRLRHCSRESAAEPSRGLVAGPRHSAARLSGACALLLWSQAAPAFTVNILPGSPKQIYLQVGVGSFNGHLDTGGTPANNSTINLASVSVAATAVGNGQAQTLTTNSTVGASSWDGYLFCNTPNEMYIGGYYRSLSGSNVATVTATVPAALVDAAGDQLNFSAISWTSSGNGDSGGQPFPAGSFVKAATQTVGFVAQNQWAESCWTFSYANASVPRQGTYAGRVLFTMTAP